MVNVLHKVVSDGSQIPAHVSDKGVHAISPATCHGKESQLGG